MISIDGYYYKCEWSSNVDNRMIDDFIRVKNTVFGLHEKRNDFKLKYLDNIYGDSVIVVVYDKKNPVAARALWRNDLEKRKAYQPCDTCVIQKYRGKKIFTHMTKKSTEKIDKDAIIYNFPNDKSIEGYLKMGWSIIATYRLRLFKSNTLYQKEHPRNINNNYLRWWLMQNRKNFYTVKKNNTYYLVKHLKWIFYLIIGSIEAENQCLFQKASLSILLYSSKKETFYNKNRFKLNIIIKKDYLDSTMYIPPYKRDSIID